ncbi:serpentine type 7TM GPCR chemoreceptor srh domain-containing protein [Ditylenchus destructor]|uniref:Serpentine type 7TM GPCR chemoreceptor srh domain-containing protein n=1 Tax=Ditylenchus destructor TaxID=166010 RepID=A0AAD4MX89_9BILA|nr:serpentine type 7TM GPCR chemoreceptor srh domain-containing protein [Ditylenchus destructor]
MQQESYVEIVPPPPFILLINDTLAYIQLVVSPALYALLVWMVYYKSPPAMGAYKWYTIWNATYLMVSEVLYAFAHPEPLFPYPVAIAGGFAKFVPVGQTFANIYTDVAIFFIMSSFYSTMVLFLFRYLQTTDSDFMRFFTNPKFAILCNAAALTFATAMIIVPLHFQWTTREEKLSLAGDMNLIDPSLRQRLLTLPLIGVKREPLLLVAGYSAAILSSFVGVVVVGSILGIYHFLRQNKKSFSKRTYALYRSLINVLVIDMLFCGLLVLFPLILSLAVFLFQLKISSLVALITLTTASWYPLCTHVVMISCVTPYRRALVGIFRKVLQQKQESRLFYTKTHIHSQGNLTSVVASENGRNV